MEKIKQTLRLIRPHQWLKNAFVFTGLIFSHEWTDPFLFLKVFFTAIAFSIISSSIYILNDVVDRDNDRFHPKKKFRPLAAGTLSVPYAISLSLTLVITGLVISFLISTKVLIIIGLYLILNSAYSFYLKRIVILDVFCIASGFMLRILAGTIGIGIPPSKWLLLCGLMITLFLGFAKRRAELISLSRNREEFREVLSQYEPVALDEMISVCAAGVIISYSLYTMSYETIQIHHTESLIYTVPFVIYGLFRYIYLLHHSQIGGEPSTDLINDKHIVLSVIGWFILTLILFLKNSPISN